MTRVAFLSAVAVALAGCSSSTPRLADGGADLAASCQPGAPMTIPVLTARHLDSAASAVDVMVSAPAGCWSSAVVQLHVKTTCSGARPAGQNWPAPCDPFDRLAQVWLNDQSAPPLFLVDAVTSFGGDTTWLQDVTDYAALLAGTHTFHVQVDTYADPAGKATGTAASHDVDVSLILTPGAPPRDVVAALPILRTTLDTGHPTAMAGFTAPAGAAHAVLHYFLSGHGGNGTPPCDEFCQKENDVTVDGATLYADSPVSDCSNNCTHVASGTITCGGQSFNYSCQQNPTACPSSAVAPRSNWCPSQIITPLTINLPDAALAAGPHAATVTVVGVDGSWPIGLSAVYYR